MKSAFASAWQPKQSWGWAALSNLNFTSGLWIEWQSVQPTLLSLWIERWKFMCSCEFWWQSRQVSLAFAGGIDLKLTILEMSPPASTWSLPGPWQDSHPCPMSAVNFFEE